MKVLVTGAGGFIGKNLVSQLNLDKELILMLYDMENSQEELERFLDSADFVFHLAGVNRPKDEAEFSSGNKGLTEQLVEFLTDKHARTGVATPMMISSSTQAALDNPYGVSKRDAETIVFEYARQTGAEVFVYRFPNVYGKWCRPNYNSAIATFCYNTARDLPITVNSRDAIMHIVYIDDVVRELANALHGQANRVGDYCEVPVTYHTTLGRIVDIIESFPQMRKDLLLPDFSDGLSKTLYSTYLSYLPEDQFSYPLKMNVDHRGSFTEFVKSGDRGQVSINISRPGIVKGNHWHHTKTEKFLVVKGQGDVSFRRIDSDRVITYHVSGESLEVVDIPTGYTHNIKNTGEEDMVTVMWANELLDPNHPDTYFLEV
ncbi:MAG TPA: capsular polysaccharide biosynthesis protein CapF [Clostridiaceae bacterium]|jgi:UDP-2-acetamido-2,6-beta-L-arabino-hexul-4-ose reductase|nr:capsular polysaccharide biosynthesis protein CapF [Clostridiaceae bacterium]